MTEKQFQNGLAIKKEIENLKKFLDPICCKKKVQKRMNVEEETRIKYSISLNYIREDHNCWDKDEINVKNCPKFIEGELNYLIKNMIEVLVKSTELKIKELELELLKI